MSTKIKKLKFDQWLKVICIVIDTREKEINHITSVLNELGVCYMFEKLDSGDYSYILSEYDIPQKIIIERKNSLDEIAGNFTKNRDRFKREWDRVDISIKKHLIIEDNLNKVFTGHYRSNLHVNSFIASLLSFSAKYNIQIHYLDKKNFANYMLRLFYYNDYYYQGGC